jgi:hypothetical protein
MRSHLKFLLQCLHKHKHKHKPELRLLRLLRLLRQRLLRVQVTMPSV